MYIATCLNTADGEVWFPRTSVYRSRFFGEQIELFQKMVSANHFNRVKILLKVSSKEELINKIDKYAKALQSGNIQSVKSWNYNIPAVDKVFDVEKIASIE